jgi:RNA recognition motif. (a.k.a. RRM, RBD, or RNP domain)
MSFPPPPGLKTSQTISSTAAPQHSSLPPRPPPPAGPVPSFKPALSASPSFSGAPGTASGGYNGASSASTGFPAFRPRQIAGGGSEWRSNSPAISAPPAPAAGYGFSQIGYAGVGYDTQQQYQQQQQQQHYYPQVVQDTYTHVSPPQIRNPFPLPGQDQGSTYGRGQGGGRDRYQDSGLDPEMEAQIAQWQSAYAGKDANEQPSGRGGGRGGRGQGFEGSGAASGANAGPLGGRADVSQPTLNSAAVASAIDGDSGVAAVVTADGKQKTVVRSGGGQTWADPTLLEWDPAHFRLFVGNLAGEVTDDSLLKAFSRYPSVQKARVVRDKRSTKSKGYGFVSFSDGEEYFQAAREMQGKYIGSHPVLLRRSTTEIRPVVPNDKKGGKYGKGKGGGSRSVLDAKAGGGVHKKKQSKTKGGLHVLG